METFGMIGLYVSAFNSVLAMLCISTLLGIYWKDVKLREHLIQLCLLFIYMFSAFSMFTACILDQDSVVDQPSNIVETTSYASILIFLYLFLFTLDLRVYE